jgi:hypothetical protein
MDVEQPPESRLKETKPRRLHGSEDAPGQQPARNKSVKPVGEAHPTAAPQPSSPAPPTSRPQFQTGDMRGIANVGQQVAEDLRPQFPEMAEYLAGAAAGLKRLLDLIEEPGVTRFTSGVRDLARAQPALFVAGAMLAGIVLWRVFSTSSAAQAGGPSDTNR